MSEVKPELLITKTRLPQLQLNCVARPRLSSKLIEALRHKLVLLSAPAGYGKTTLVIETLQNCQIPAGWVSLETSDNIPGNFWNYFIVALQSVIKGVCQPALDAIQSPQPPPVEWLLAAITNSISGHDSDFALVLDDYHTIESQAIHEAVSYLIEHLPPQAHLVIASRIDPPLPLARWRVKGDITEIRADNLSFTTAEATAFIKNTVGIALSEQDLAMLENRTEGWIAGLKMAALSLPGKKDVSSYIKAFSGSNRYIMDYLGDEVLSQQPANIKQFLLETSILKHLSGSLCDAVTERNDSQDILAQLETANLFISALDDERRWFRYHPLFATILSNQLTKLYPERVKLLHCRASMWYQKEGLTEEAIDYALLGGEAERAVGLLESVAPQILSQSRVPLLLDYLSRIPQSNILAHPWLCSSLAWAALLAGKQDIVATMLSGAKAALSENPERLTAVTRANLQNIKGHIFCIQGFIAQARGDIDNSIRLFEEADRELEVQDLLARCANTYFLATDYMKTGNIVKAISRLEEAAAGGLKSGNYAVFLSSQAYLAEMEMQRSRFDQANEICQDTIKQGLHWGGTNPLPYTANAYIVWGEAMYEQNDLEGASKNLTEGIKLAETSLNWTFVLKGCILMAQLSQAKGELAAVDKYIQRADDMALRVPHSREGRQIPAWKARMALRRGDMSAASDWSHQAEISLPLSHLPAYQQEYDYLTLSRVKLAKSEFRDLPVYLEGIIRNAESQGQSNVVIEALLLKALALDGLGKLDLAITTLDYALSLAEPSGYVRSFIDEGLPVVSLLRRMISGSKHVAYVSKLLDTTSQPQDLSLPATSDVKISGLIDALSEREIEVLKLIANGKSNQETAIELFLAIGTVKKHTYNIFGKLGVKSRTQAIARARELHII